MDCSKEFNEFSNIIDTLLGENGCPWDKAQNEKTLTRHLMEECYEAIDAANNENSVGLCEEIGDVLLMVLMYSKIAENNDKFNLRDVINGISQKIVLRHPHIFDDVKTIDSQTVIDNWDLIKNKEKGYNNNTEALRSIPKAMPALLKAEKVLNKAKKTGLYDFESLDENKKEIIELLSKIDAENIDKTEINAIIGQLLFRIITFSIKFKVNPEFSLTNAVEQFINRFERKELIQQEYKQN